MRERSEPRAAAALGTVAGVLVGLVLVFSAWAKALDPEGFTQLILERGLMPAPLAWLSAIVVIGLEAALGIALLLNWRRPVVLLPVAMLMAFFLALSLWSFLHPEQEASSCGCFGNLIPSSPGQALARDAVLFLLSILAFVGVPRVARAGWRWAVSAVAFIVAAGFAWVAPGLPLDNLATRLKPGVAVGSLRIDEIIPELQDGERLVLLIDRADEKTRAEISRINEKLALARPEAVFAVARPDEALANEFHWTAAPAFEVRDAPQAMLKPFYRRLPRSFLVRDGEVIEVWEGFPDDRALVAIAEGS